MPYQDSSVTKCPIADCPRSRGDDQLMCGPHWRKVPADLQRKVYAAWKARVGASKQGVDEVYSAAKKRHEAAKKAAIEAVENGAAGDAVGGAA